MRSSREQAKHAHALSWSDAPRLGPVDLVAMLWAERATLFGVAAMICAIGFAAALLLPRTYTARSELLVRLGQEYVYQPNDGAGQGVAPDMQSVLNAEMRMLGSGVVVRRAIREVGLTSLYPELARASGSEEARIAAAERAFAAHLTLETAPQTPSIALSFKHKDPSVAARALNALVDAYLSRRREVLVGGESDALQRQSSELDGRVQAANAALSDFLTTNRIGDFESELSSAAQRLNEIDAQLLDADAKRREADGRRTSLRARYAAEPAEIELYSESDARRALVQAQLEREQLLSRYQEDAMPVREVDRRISQLQLFLAGGDPASLTRRGPNPVRQDIATQLITAEAEMRAQSGRADALRLQRAGVAERLRALQNLQPDFTRLMRARTILEQSAGNFASRAEEARSFSQLLGRSTDNISEVERASPPTQGQSLRLPVAIATVLLSGLLGVAAALGRGLMRRGFPTPSSAARTLGAPVLAVLPRKRGPKNSAPDRALRPRPDLRVVQNS
ncbi:MAG TPA: hypothetical protein VG841_16090 [Caulobacterales bacterium]|nr:hypothetical protein [Caulobacterales bacterium]